jgi:hypothetical protein
MHGFRQFIDSISFFSLRLDFHVFGYCLMATRVRIRIFTYQDYGFEVRFFRHNTPFYVLPAIGAWAADLSIEALTPYVASVRFVERGASLARWWH